MLHLLQLHVRTQSEVAVGIHHREMAAHLIKQALNKRHLTSDFRLDTAVSSIRRNLGHSHRLHRRSLC